VDVSVRTEKAWVDQCSAIERKCFAKHEAMNLELELKPRSATLLCAASEEEPASCIGYALVQRASLATSVSKLVVAPAWRRRGVGLALMRAAVDAAARARAQLVTLHVDEENAAARALYERAGFRVSGRREDYYRAGRHALAMSLELGD